MSMEFTSIVINFCVRHLVASMYIELAPSNGMLHLCLTSHAANHGLNWSLGPVHTLP